MIWADDMEFIHCQTAFIRSHGVPPATIELLRKRGYNTIDATCPFVKRAQNIAHELEETGIRLLL